MSRRVLVVLSSVLACALAVTAVALAHGGSGGDQGGKPSVAHAERVAKLKGQRPERGLDRMLGQGIVGMVVDSLAGRLQVQPAALRTAITQVATEQRAKFRQKLPNAPKPDLAQLKTDVAASLASKLGKSPADVLTAVRAELAQRLDQAAGIGLVTAKGKDLALACFDDPAKCDLQALRAEIKLPFGHDGRDGENGAAGAAGNRERHGGRGLHFLFG